MYDRPSPTRRGATYVAVAGLGTNDARVVGVYDSKRRRDLKDLPSGVQVFTIRQAKQRFYLVRENKSSRPISFPPIPHRSLTFPQRSLVEDGDHNVGRLHWDHEYGPHSHNSD